jgi:HSP20 family protein
MTLYISSYPVRAMRRMAGGTPHTTSEGNLAVNIREEENAYLLSALVPGLKAEDLDIQILDDMVSIAGEYKPDETGYLVCELPHGAFQRTLRLPVPLDPGSAEAKIADGILSLRLPTAESARPKIIKVTAK